MMVVAVGGALDFRLLLLTATAWFALVNCEEDVSALVVDEQEGSKERVNPLYNFR